jgi:hypothetical protein
MFFSWFEDNRAFERGRGIKGQIAPFLIVILAILLIAAIATINIGRIGLDKTYSANSADSGALAGASGMAGVMNFLTTNNLENLKNQFDLFFWGQYRPTYEQAEDYIENAIIALNAACIMIGFMDKYWEGVDTTCQRWAYIFEYLGSIIFTAICTTLVYEASKYVRLLLTVLVSELSYLDNFHEAQWNRYCSLREAADEGRDSAEESAYYLAYSNSGIPNKLSTQQADAFSYWLGEKDFSSGSFSWQDKLGQDHSVSVNVTVPAIGHYRVQHTKDNYKWIRSKLEECISTSQTIGNILNTISTILASTLVLLVAGFVSHIIYSLCDSCSTWWCGFCAAVFCVISWVCLWGSKASFTTLILLIEELLFTGGIICLPSVDKNNDAAFKGLRVNGSVSSKGCKDVSDLIIVKISSVPYPGDVLVTSTQTHPGQDSGLFPTRYPRVTSSASADYRGNGDVGSFHDEYRCVLSGAN